METITIGNDLLAWDVRADFPDQEPGYARREPGQIQHITIHHDGALFLFPSTRRREQARLTTIYRYHRAQGWPGIGYHLVVAKSGRVYYTGDWATIRYHAGGEHNVHSLGVCLMGDFRFHAQPPYRQRAAARRVVGNLRFLFERRLPIFAHYEEAQTECPGSTWPLWKASLEGG